LQTGKSLGATLILYGHTHRRYLLETADYTVLNPGTPEESYGVITMDQGKICSVEICETLR